MAKQTEVFARKASGLTREAGLLDSTYFGIMNNAVPVSLWFVLAAYAWSPGGNLVLATIITLVLVVFGFAPVWGILGAAMPRSGGSYVYNSRIIHPAIGLAVSFCNAGFVMLGWIWVLAPWVGEVGIPIFVGLWGIDPEAVDAFTHGWGLYFVATVVNVSAFLVVLKGMKSYFKIQKVLVTWSLLGAVIAGFIIMFTSHEKFVAIWNSQAAQFGSLEYSAAVAAAAAEMGGIPATWNWPATLGFMLPIAWIAIYGYIITFIGGEVKSPRRNIFMAQILNALVCIIFLLWVGLAFKRMVGWEGIHALAWISEEGLAGYSHPFIPTYMNIAGMIIGYNKFVGFLMGGAFNVAIWLWVVFSYIAWSRAAFAWGMDNLGPRWFTELSPKSNQPVKLLLVMLVASQIALTHYSWDPQFLGAIGVEVLQMISVFGITAISLIIFPYRNRVKHIWEASPHKNWKVAGIPVATISGILALVLVAILIYSFYTSEGLEFIRSVWTYIYIFVWAFGILWYYIWKAIRLKEGIDVTLAFMEIPPE